jgi:hypothetical protein
VRVVDLDADGEPEVVLDLYSGGAHCCSSTQVFRWDPGTSAYLLSQHFWGDPGALLTDLRHDGRLEFRSADDRFAGQFAAFAFSGLPLQIWRFSAGRFIDVTRSFPSLIVADANGFLRDYKRTRAQGLGLGLLAAWAADEELLGRGALVTSTLARELRLGHLRSVSGWEQGRQFVTSLKRFLRRAGYR